MKRSEINAAVAAARTLFGRCGYALPPFADWTDEAWATAGEEARHLREARLGWDVTDYGRDDFLRCGLTLFTVRNGRLDELKAGRGFCYAEKAMRSGPDQLAPMHRHETKVEDIVNRGGATLVLELRPMAADGGVDRSRGARLMSDGVWTETGSDGLLRLRPGESVTITPDVWHAFWGEGGEVFVGEVSSVNDDQTDNIFEEPVARFPRIEEDERPAARMSFDR